MNTLGGYLMQNNSGSDSINTQNNNIISETTQYHTLDTNHEILSNTKIIRRSFSKFNNIDKFDLTSVQQKPYAEFLQQKVQPSKRKNVGLQRIFKKVFPIINQNKLMELDFINYKLIPCKDTVQECKDGGLTYSVSLQAKFKRTVYAINETTKIKEAIDVCEQDVFLGSLPLMTDQATFVVSGVERAVVFQLHRAPGVFFQYDASKSTKGAHIAKVIPAGGSWLEFEYGGSKNECFVRIDRRKKISVVPFLMCLNSKYYQEGDDLGRSGMSKAEILALYYDVNTISKIKDGWVMTCKPQQWTGLVLKYNLVDAETRKVIGKIGQKISTVLKVEKVFLENLTNQYLSEDIVNTTTGAILGHAGEELTDELVNQLAEHQIVSFKVLAMTNMHWRNNVDKEPACNRKEALSTFYKSFRPGESPATEIAYELFQKIFFRPDSYDLSEVGRVRLNSVLEINHPHNIVVLTKEDITNIMKRLLQVKDGKAPLDDIDCLGHRRIRSVGELLEAQCLTALNRIKRLIKEKMNITEIENTTPHNLFNSLLFMSAVREFFVKSPLSQFLEHTNPLSALTHVRKVSALGPGGLQKGNVMMDVRDAHVSATGKLCLATTPEGIKVGLVHSLALNAQVDQYGFLQGMYRKVENGVITDQIAYLSVLDDQKYNIAYGDCARDNNNRLIGEEIDGLVECKRGSETILVPIDQVDYIDSSTSHITSISASLIPGFENTDGTRNLMASNMQGQAVPQIFTQTPIVGTGLEELIARNTQSCLYARRAGKVIHVEGSKITVQADTFDPVEGLIDIYRLKKYNQSNSGTCINQIPVVKIGQKVQINELLADGQSTKDGELSLGSNIRIAFLSHPGAFEDAIIVSQNLLKQDVFSSIHIQELEVIARDTKLGAQEITGDIPDIESAKLQHLDESGIVQKGTKVYPGMILVGRTTPKLDSAITGEDRLVRAIFKNAASNVRNESLYVPAGITGTVIDVKVFTRKNTAKTERGIAMQKAQLIDLQKERDLELEALETSFVIAFKSLIIGSVVEKDFKSDSGVILKEGHVIAERDLPLINLKVKIDNVDANNLISKYVQATKTIQEKFIHNATKVKSGVDLQVGILKIVKVYIAIKRNIQPGDKLAGRYGNKGVVSYCLPAEQMPYTADGQPVDLVLTPLGIVSRMNLGQIMEIHLGRASLELQKKLGTMLKQCELGVEIGVKQGYLMRTMTPKRPTMYKIQEESDDSPAITVYEDCNWDLNDKDRYVGEGCECVEEGCECVEEGCRDVDECVQRSVAVNDIRNLICQIYEDKKEFFVKLNDVQLIEKCWSIYKRGVHFAAPVFSGARRDDINKLFELAQITSDGKEVLYNGKTGEKIDSKVTVGSMYILKLHHLVDDKMHARSVGPYSAVTLQPLGGKAQDGGQRVGEMEGWAIQAYGSANVLLEMMTIKSDSVEGRIEAYKSIISGLSPNFLSSPAVFSVFTKELQALCLKIECKQREIPLQDGWRRDHDIESIAIKLQSPEDVLNNSFGEVIRSETINHRTGKTELDGLFCQRIFGPVKDYECFCGKYKKIRDRGRTCDRCGVEVTKAWVRRERLGHITLPAPVLHPWFYRALPSKICLILNMSFSDIDSVVNMDKYMVVDPGMSMLGMYQILTEQEYAYEQEQNPDTFVALTGAEAILQALKNMDLAKEKEKVLQSLDVTSVAIKCKKLIARLKLLDSFIDSKQKPEWMVMTVIPVLPADLRPIVPIEAGRYASSDLNEHYKCLINRVRRLERLVALQAPEVLIKSEKRLLQEAVDNLFDNGRRERPVLGANKRPLRSLSDGLKGKQGIFRQNLLGKRVDYSGRSVIAVDAGGLKLHQCGIPKAMALELFKPFVYARLIRDGLALTLKDAKRMLDEEHHEVWDVLKDVVHRHPVLLNRAPTLHRLSMRAFEPVLVDGKAIRLHPLVCSAYNADFDGDQIAIHVPLSNLAQLEARLLMGSAVNQLKPSDGKSAILPSKDMILGLYYMTQLKKQDPTRYFYTLKDLISAYHMKTVELQEPVNLFIDGKWTITCAGRAIVFDTIDSNDHIKFELLNKEIKVKQITELFTFVYKRCGQKFTAILADKIMNLGFTYATKSGISFGLNDLKELDDLPEILSVSREKEKVICEEYQDGLITTSERYNKLQELWLRTIENVSEKIQQQMSQVDENDRENPVYSMINSGARGTKQQLLYMIGIRGLVVKPNGEIKESPVLESYVGGLSMKSFAATIPGVRKGLVDVALKTAVAGYLTRKLVDVAQDITVTEIDCKTTDGLYKSTVLRGETIATELGDRILGRVLAQDVLDAQGNCLLQNDSLIDEHHITLFKKHNIQTAKIRSILTCKAKKGVCVRCYGIDPGRQQLVTNWTAVGVIGAQSISEPSMQLTMRSFHSGGGAKKDISESTFSAQESGIVHFVNHRLVTNRAGQSVVVCKNMEIILTSNAGVQIAKYQPPYGAKILIKNGQRVEINELIAEWEPYIIPIIAQTTAIIEYCDLIEGISTKQDDLGFGVVIDHTSVNKSLKPSLLLMKENGQPILTEQEVELKYYLNPGMTITVKSGQKIYPGDVLAKFSTAQLKSSDMVGGLTMISQLFEVNKPKDCAIISDIAGTVQFAKDYRSHRRIIIEPKNEETDVPREYLIPYGAHLLVQEGHEVAKGEALIDGMVYVADILRVLGIESMVEHFINAVQDVYRAQGINVNEKHIEVIMKPMLQTVEIFDSGDSIYLPGERIDKDKFEQINNELIAMGKKPAKAHPYLQGISDRKFNNSSIATAAFQDAIRYICEAACNGTVEYVGESVKIAMMTGNLIQQGTGGYLHQQQQEILQNKELQKQELNSIFN